MVVSDTKLAVLYNEIAQARGNRKVALLNALAEKLQKEDVGEALAVVTKAYTLTLKLLSAQWKKHSRQGNPADIHHVVRYAESYPDYIHGLANSCYIAGRCHTLLSNKAEAVFFLAQARTLYEALRDSNGVVKTLYAIARTYMRNDMHETALDVCMQGLGLRQEGINPENVIYLLRTAADIHYSMGKNDVAIEYYTQALDLMNRTGVEKGREHILTGFGMTYCAMHRNPEALQYLQESLHLARREGSTRTEANILLHLARVYWGLGDYQQALDTDMEALVLCEAIDDRFNISYLQFNIGNIYFVLGDYETAGEHYNKSLKAAESIEHLSSQASALEGLAMLYTEWKEYQTALEYFYRALYLYEQCEDTFGGASIVSNLGVVYQKMDNREKAWEQFSHFLAISRKIQYQEGEIIACYNLGEMQFVAEGYEQAEHFYLMGLAISEEIEHRSKICRGEWLLGKVYHAQGKSEKALEYLTKALVQVHKLNQKDFLLEIHRELSELYEKTGEYEKTFYHYREYHRIEKEMFSEQAHEKVKKLEVLHKVEQAEKEKEIYRITSEKLQQENELQRKELASKAMYLSQKNELLNKMRKTLRGIARDTAPDIATRIRGIVSEIETTLADEQTWGMFEEQFQKLEQPFMQALTERYPALSPLEVRVCALIKLNLSSKEISRILNVASRSIEVYRYRIRKKLGFDSTDNLNSFLLLLDQK